MTPDKAKADNLPTTGTPLPGVQDMDLNEFFSEEPPRQLTEEEVQVIEDMNWASDDPEIERLYEGKIIAVHRRRVIAVGDDWKTVIEEGERVSGLPGNLFAVVSIPDTASFFGCH